MGPGDEGDNSVATLSARLIWNAMGGAAADSEPIADKDNADEACSEGHWR